MRDIKFNVEGGCNFVAHERGGGQLGPKKKTKTKLWERGFGHRDVGGLVCE